MLDVDYVYPNLSPIFLKSESQRGGLVERWTLAKENDCKYIEVPGTLIKNKTEEKLTNLDIGDFLSEKEISLLYSHDDKLPSDLKYILHTEPSLSKPNRYGRRIQPEIKWYDDEWVGKFTKMVFRIIEYLNRPASIIEIHPGYKKNSFEDIASFIEKFLSLYFEKYGFKPLILLENRTEQFISRGRDIRDYWDYLTSYYPDLVDLTGIVLDVQQLYTKTRGNFIEEYMIVPDDCLKAFHIHTKHRWPKLSDNILWKFVFGRIKELDSKVLINPEIHQKRRVKQVIQFCNNLLE